MVRRTLALAGIAAAALAAGLALASPSEPDAQRAFDLKCGVFPKPGADVPANAPSLPDQRAWNQDITQAPVDPRSTQIIDYINSHEADTLHPDFGSPREYGIPFEVVGKRAKRVKVR